MLPIVIGDGELPSSMRNLARLELREPGNVAGLADAVAARVKDLVLPEES